MTLLTNRVAGVIVERGGEGDGETEIEVTAMKGGAGGTGRRIITLLIEQRRQQ